MNSQEDITSVLKVINWVQSHKNIKHVRRAFWIRGKVHLAALILMPLGRPQTSHDVSIPGWVPSHHCYLKWLFFESGYTHFHLPFDLSIGFWTVEGAPLLLQATDSLSAKKYCVWIIIQMNTFLAERFSLFYYHILANYFSIIISYPSGL